MRQYRIHIVIVLVVVLCSLSLAGVVRRLFNPQTETVNSAIVVSSPAPVAVPMLPARQWREGGKHVSSGTSLRRQSVIAAPSSSSPMGPLAHGIYKTGSAQVQSIGGGNMAGIAVSHTSGRNTPQNPAPANSQAAVMTSFIAMASARTIAQPEAGEAPQMAQIASAPRRAPGPPDIPNPPVDKQLVEPPVGDAVLPLLLLLCAYAIYKASRRRVEE
ncbi:MAG: hypothetical protein IJ548_04430 [Paludibacteraceae bacterium]|nr:hypothetical protein [Paludibacteraceae bacterium]MBQ9297124.1 hypothetical protein [Paludibacteraceae bacterium]MBR1556467.1 hypothetical protein [Prevotella sp.]